MNAILNGLGHELLALLGDLSIELAALAVLVLLAGRLLRLESSALRHFLWVVVLLKPIVALSISSPWTVFTPLVGSFEPSSLSSGYTSQPWLAEGLRGSASTAMDGSGVPLSLVGWLAALWVLGAALLLGRIAIGYGVIWRLQRQARIHRAGALFDALERARLALDLKPSVAVATSGSIHSPIVLGILRPLIVVPTDLLERLGPDQVQLILMHELAHVRRYDNLTLLMQRLSAAVLFFHPAVWLCGRMLRQEAEQACDDLVVCASGRCEAYACSLTNVAELAQEKINLKRRIPLMNVYPAAESDLVLRIRRALGGRARPMGTGPRLLAAFLLFGLGALTLPSCSSDKSASTDPAGKVAGEEELRTEASGPEEVWRLAMATDPDEWSDELKAQILALKPESTIDKIAAGIRQRRVWQEAMSTDPDEWSDELEAQILALKPESTIEEIAAGIRQRQEVGADLEALGRRIRAAVENGRLTSEEGRERMEAARRAAGNKEGTDLEALGRRIRAAVESGKLTPEEGREKMEAARRSAGNKEGTDLEALGRRIRMAVAEGKLTPEEGREKMEAARRSAGEDKTDELGEFKRGVVARAMAEPPEEWSDELKAAIERVGWDLDEFSEGVRRRQAALRDRESAERVHSEDTDDTHRQRRGARDLRDQAQDE